MQENKEDRNYGESGLGGKVQNTLKALQKKFCNVHDEIFHRRLVCDRVNVLSQEFSKVSSKTV